MKSFNNLTELFLGTVEEFPNNIALEQNSDVLSYLELSKLAWQLANTFESARLNRGVRITAVLGQHSITSFAGILAALMRGDAYLPINPSFPSHRISSVIQLTGIQRLIVDSNGRRILDAVLEEGSAIKEIVLPDSDDIDELRSKFPSIQFFDSSQVSNEVSGELPFLSSEDMAYVLFTSGSTGKPKGVKVSHGNVVSFLKSVFARYDLRATDRISHTFSLTFDLSVFDMFATWATGACLCCPSPKALIKPGQYIRDKKLTVWFSVPSTAIFMQKLGELKPDSYPGLRLSLFCGEALPVSVAKAWQIACPASAIENLYGPTELTIACTAFRWQTNDRRKFARNLVPIGKPFPGLTAIAVDDNLELVPEGMVGELIVSGPQTTMGYWEDEERTSSAFVVLSGERYYRTGDLVRRLDDGNYLYLGRRDDQIQVHGHRVELGDVESAIRDCTKLDGVAAVGWPQTGTGAAGIVAFVESDALDQRALRRGVAERLPSYMIPSEFHAVAKFPTNTNGKIDRNALLKQVGKDLTN